MKFKYNDVEIDYEVYGEGKPILMLHGYGVDRRCLFNSIEPLSDDLKGYKRVYLDLPHMGKSNWPDSVNSSDDYLEIVVKFIESIVPNVSAVVGYSYGGYLTMGLQQRMPELNAFLLCSVTEPTSSKRTVPKEKIIFVDDFIQNMKIDPLGYKHSVIQTKEKYERFILDYEESLKISNGEKLSEIFHNNYQYSFELCDQVFGKTTALFGRLDTVVGYMDFWQLEHLYENVDVVILDHAGHSLAIEQPKRFEEVFFSWVREI